MPTPRVFIIRHGETDWSLTGRHTSTTDLPLTPDGKLRISSTSTALLGPDRLIAPSNLAQIYLSPMQRAQTTFHLLHPTCSPQETQITTTPLLHEWNYGIYEGLTTPEIRALRKGSGLDSDDYDWDIWLDGCEGGESPEDVEKRCDELIREIRDRWHARYFRGECDRGDVLLVAHGHLLRAFAMRWIGKRLSEKVSMVLEAGGVGTLSYEHGNLREPAILLGGSFVVDPVKGEADGR